MTRRQKRKNWKDAAGLALITTSVAFGIWWVTSFSYQGPNLTEYQQEQADAYCQQTSGNQNEYDRCMAVDEIGK